MSDVGTDLPGLDRRSVLLAVLSGAGSALAPFDRAMGTGSLAGIAAGNRATVVNFWATWCAGCVSEMPALESTFRQMRARGVGFVGVNNKESQTTVSDFVRKRGVSYPMLLDPSGAIFDSYGVSELPSTLVLDPSGAVRIRFSGETTSASLRAKVEAVLRAA